jgi:hypothetical protein
MYGIKYGSCAAIERMFRGFAIKALIGHAAHSGLLLRARAILSCAGAKACRKSQSNFFIRDDFSGRACSFVRLAGLTPPFFRLRQRYKLPPVSNGRNARFSRS